jgi:hypothetical protein
MTKRIVTIFEKNQGRLTLHNAYLAASTVDAMQAINSQ